MSWLLDGSTEMIYQIQYCFRGRIPTRKDIDEARNAFIHNRHLPGVTVHPIAWTGTIENLRKVLCRSQVGSSNRSNEHNQYFIGQAGFVKQYADRRLTMCDYDSQHRAPLHVIIRLAAMLRLKPRWLREDRTKHGWHLLIRWNRSLKPLETVALQCLLGSDREREAYNLARVMSGKKSRRWNLLFERKV